MRVNNRNKKILLTDFLRYREGAMTGEEKNYFERELQKNPFAEEAAKGFDLISQEEALKDVNLLQKRLSVKVSGRKRFMVYRIAASIAVLMVISTVFIIIERNKPAKQLSKIAMQTEALEITKNQPLTESATKEEASERRAIDENKKADKITVQQVSMESGQKAGAGEKAKTVTAMISDSIPEISTAPIHGFVADAQIVAPVAVPARKNASTGFQIRGKVLASEDNMPVPGVSILIKGTNKGVITDASGNFNISIPDSNNQTLVANFIGMTSQEFAAKADSEIRIRLNPSVSTLNEVVVVGYGSKRAEYDNKEESSGYVLPQPANGRSEFEKYIRENQQRPDTTTSGQRVVVILSFLVHQDGSIDSIRIVRSPGKPFSDEAIRLIRSGPSWKPAEDKGQIIEDEVRLRIVFR
jgi:hypothetical protein